MSLVPGSPRQVTDPTRIESLERDFSMLHGLTNQPSKKIVALSKSFVSSSRGDEVTPADGSREHDGLVTKLSARQNYKRNFANGNRRGSNDDLSIHEGVISSARFDVARLIPGEEPKIAGTTLGTTANNTVVMTPRGSTMQHDWPVDNQRQG